MRRLIPLGSCRSAPSSTSVVGTIAQRSARFTPTPRTACLDFGSTPSPCSGVGCRPSLSCYWSALNHRSFPLSDVLHQLRIRELDISLELVSRAHPHRLGRFLADIGARDRQHDRHLFRQPESA